VTDLLEIQQSQSIRNGGSSFVIVCRGPAYSGPKPTLDPSAETLCWCNVL